MFKLFRVRDIVRIPPEYFGMPLNEAATEVLRRKYEGVILENLGLVLSVFNVTVEEEGRIVPGDGATYHRAEFDLLTFTPVLQEVVEGVVVDVTKFGLFVNIGPLDALIHKSQVTDERVEYDMQRGALIAQESKRIVEKGDVVRARIVAVSSGGGQALRIAMTMRQPFLGKIEWIKEEVARIESRRK